MELSTIEGLINHPVYIGKEIYTSNVIIDQILSIEDNVVILSDNHIAPLYGKPFYEAISKRSNKNNIHFIEFMSGEQNKNRKTKANIENNMLENNIGRDTCLVAIGGGITTDLGGFVASTYCRGISSVYMPTSLLCMVDACIGGKTGINTTHGKNLLGTFYHPSCVYIDLSMLNTLPINELKNGIVEMIKLSIIRDERLFTFLENNSSHIHRIDLASLKQVILKNCRYKAEITSSDFHDKSARQVLNFGHTIGQGIEHCSNYDISHGEAVAAGSIAESFILYKRNILDSKSFQRILNIMINFISTKKINTITYNSRFMKSIVSDKKNKNNIPHIITVSSIGKTIKNSLGNYVTAINFEEIDESIQFIQSLC